MMELQPEVLSHFQYLNLFDNSTTSFMRYSSAKGTHGNLVNSSKLPWHPQVEARHGYTPPWSYQIDRQGEHLVRVLFLFIVQYVESILNASSNY